MKLIDANILLYAYDRSASHHEACRGWFEAALNGGELVGLPWQTLLAFIRLSTHARVVRLPASAEQACAVVAGWLEHPNVVVPGPLERFWEILHGQLVDAQVVGPLATDAALAALALEQGAVLCSTDKDFRRFQGLRIENPLQV
jgi:hypothetical protein